MQYRYYYRDSAGRPSRWECAPIRYRIYAQDAPAGGVELIQDAVRRIAAASGHNILYEGTSDTAPARRAGPPPGADLLIGWTAGDYGASDGYFAVGAVEETADGPRIRGAEIALNPSSSKNGKMDFRGGARSNWGMGLTVVQLLGYALNGYRHTGPDQIFSEQNSPSIGSELGPDDRGLLRSVGC